MHDRDDPFDIFSQQARGNHALYEQMRTDDPVHRAIDPQSGQVVWFLTRYDDCVSFMKDRRFSKEDRTRSGVRGDTHDSINRNMLNLDEPDHTRLKTLVGAKKTGLIRYSEHIEGNGDAFFSEACRAGLEGIVSKRRDQPHQAGRHGGRFVHLRPSYCVYRGLSSASESALRYSCAPPGSGKGAHGDR